MAIIDARYFKDYRQKLGFASQSEAKIYFGAKDLTPAVDFDYIELLNERLCGIIFRINEVVVEEIKADNLDIFYSDYITHIYSILGENNIFANLNNQGRRPEEVYFSWMRGFLISSYFIKALGIIFDVDPSAIDSIGDDDFKNPETFRRTPKADLQVTLKNSTILRIEIQSGFQGLNDIKQHKILEAKRIKREAGLSSIIIHFDLYNGQVAFLEADKVNDSSLNWITRQQMEGQTVFNIDQNFFFWKLTEKPPKFNEFCNSI
ncbi:MAG TPA: restriction endonuclease [Bacteroidales bacterium]|nr:restriction endonuclease [Bacteroidales bacterium]